MEWANILLNNTFFYLGTDNSENVFNRAVVGSVGRAVLRSAGRILSEMKICVPSKF